MGQPKRRCRRGRDPAAASRAAASTTLTGDPSDAARHPGIRSTASGGRKMTSRSSRYRCSTRARRILAGTHDTRLPVCTRALSPGEAARRCSGVFICPRFRGCSTTATHPQQPPGHTATVAIKWRRASAGSNRDGRGSPLTVNAWHGRLPSTTAPGRCGRRGPFASRRRGPSGQAVALTVGTGLP